MKKISMETSLVVLFWSTLVYRRHLLGHSFRLSNSKTGLENASRTYIHKVNWVNHPFKDTHCIVQIAEDTQLVQRDRNDLSS